MGSMRYVFWVMKWKHSPNEIISVIWNLRCFVEVKFFRASFFIVRLLWFTIWVKKVIKYAEDFSTDADLQRDDRCVSTVLEVCFDQNLVFLNRARGTFDRARPNFDMFWSWRGRVSNLCSTQAPVSTFLFRTSTDMSSTFKAET